VLGSNPPFFLAAAAELIFPKYSPQMGSAHTNRECSLPKVHWVRSRGFRKSGHF